MRIVKVVFLLSFTFVLLSGCWDTINLEDRGFIIGAGIDLDEKKGEDYVFDFTNQFVLPKGFANPSQGGGGQKAFMNITSKGSSIYMMGEELSAKTSKAPYFEHLKILLISEELSKEKDVFTELLDNFIRDVNIRRGIYVSVTKDDTKTILDFKAEEDQLPSINIMHLLEHSYKESGFLEPLTIGDIVEYHLRGRSYILPYLSLSEKVERKAGAIFSGPKDKMVGILDEREMQGVEMFLAKATGHVVEFKLHNKTFALETIRIRNKLTIDPSDINNIKVKNDIVLEGVIKESFGKENYIKIQELKKVERAVSKQIEDSIKKTIKKSQEEYHTDVFKVWQQLETKHYNTWKKVRNDWEDGENYFSKVNFDINVTTEIYSIGTSNKTR